MRAKLSTFKSNGKVNATYQNIGKNKEDVRNFSTAVEILKYFEVTNVELIGTSV
ncbi:Uncharacterized protein LEKG_0090 [Leuconostoc gasicomitatum KG16-1]|nr:Uncharacterized protein LEKG_0090 [Leuconostoc gasicomitatum KG16-1]